MSLPDGDQLLEQSVVPLLQLPPAEGFEDFLFTDSLTLRIPVTQEAADLIHVSLSGPCQFQHVFHTTASLLICGVESAKVCRL